MSKMSRDAGILLDKMENTLGIIESNVIAMKQELAEKKVNAALHDAYLNIKDCFDLYVMARALPSILEDEQND